MPERTNEEILHAYLLGEELTAVEADSLSHLISQETEEASQAQERILLARMLPTALMMPGLQADHISAKVCAAIKSQDVKTPDFVCADTDSVELIHEPVLITRKRLSLSWITWLLQTIVTIFGTAQVLFFALVLYGFKSEHADADLFLMHGAMVITVIAIFVNVFADQVVRFESHLGKIFKIQWVAPHQQRIMMTRLHAMVMLFFATIMWVFW